MNGRSKSRIIGAFLVGFAIVAGAFALNSLDGGSTAVSALPTVSEAPLRTAINVKDSNDDGVEDWREEFVKTIPNTTTITTDEDGEYLPPTTLTGQVGLALMQRTISAKTNGVFADSQEEILNKTVDTINNRAGDKIYGVKDIIISSDSSDEAIRDYGNAMALAIIDNNVADLRDKLLILREILNSETPSQEDLDELKVISEVYLNTKNATLNIPVPKIFAKEHLDLINVYHALYRDVDTMSKVHQDPLMTLVRLKRYEDDIMGLSLAFQNMYTSLEKHARVFKEDDPAILFGMFNPELNHQQTL